MANITLEYEDTSVSECNIDDILHQLDYDNDDTLELSLFLHYSENFTVKELMQICDYYGISKKGKKEILVQILVDFEIQPLNRDIVSKRKTMWFYLNELKNDKFMRKYLIHL
jgi:hypothetical protein